MEVIPLRNVNPEMRKRIIRAMQKTWNAIAYDILVAEKNQTCRRSVVIDVVNDSDFIKTYGEDEEAYLITRRLSPNSIKILGKEAFPTSHYCI